MAILSTLSYHLYQLHTKGQSFISGRNNQYYADTHLIIHMYLT